MMKKMLLSGAASFAVLLLVTVVLGADQQRPPAAAQHQHSGSARTAPSAGKNYAMKGAPAGKLPPLPKVSFQPIEPVAQLQEVYEFAARHPEVLQFVPCYCGCQSVGHQANHDCFVKSRAASGAVTEWDEHGMGCGICVGVGRRAMTLFRQGMSVPAIRAAIDREYGSHYPTQTPTPAPPASSKRS